MKKIIQNFFRKSSTACINSFPIVLFFSNRNKDGRVIESEIFEKSLLNAIDAIPAAFECVSDSVTTNYAMSRHYQIIIETVQIVTIQNLDYPISTDELERIITSLLKFGEVTEQSHVNYMVNSTNYTLPVF